MTMQNIYFDRRSGTYRLKNFGDPGYAGDCFSIVGKIKNIDCTKDFTEILKQIIWNWKTDMPCPKTYTNLAMPKFQSF